MGEKFKYIIFIRYCPYNTVKYEKKQILTFKLA